MPFAGNPAKGFFYAFPASMNENPDLTKILKGREIER